MQPFLLKTVHIASDILIDCPDAFQNDFTKHIFPDIVGSTSTTVALVVVADVVILLALKAFACGKVELAAAIGTKQKPGEQSLPFRFCGAAFVFPQFLHPVKLCLRYNRFLCVRQIKHILRLIGNPLFQLVGLGISLEVAGTACVLLPFQNPYNGLVAPVVRSFRHRLFLSLGIECLCSQNLLFFQNPCNLLRAFAVNAKVEDELDYRSRFFIQNPVILVLRVTAVSVGRFAHVLPTGSSLPQTDTDFLAGITGIPLVEQITDCGEALAVSPVAVYAIIYSDKADIITRKDNIRILSNSQIVTTKAAEVFDQPAAHKPLLDKLKAFLHTGTIEVRPRIAVIHQNFQVCIPVVTGISG